MAGGFTKYNKLEVEDLGTEGTGDRIALFNSDGRLIGYVLKTSLEAYVPLSGTEVGKPITGDLEFILDGNDGYSLGKSVYLTGALGVNYEDNETYLSSFSGGFGYYNKITEENSTMEAQSDRIIVGSNSSGFKGIYGNIFFNKLNDPKAFAQLGDVQDATGHASYTDTAYSVGSPLTLLAGVNTVLPNNSGVIYDDEKPDDITTFYNGTTITGRDGDGLAIMIYFKATPSTINSELDIWIDIGGGIGELYRQTVYFRGATKKGVLYTLPTAYTRATWESNGGTVYVKASVNMTVYGMNFNISRTHKSKN